MEIHAIIDHLKRSCRYSHHLFKDFTIHISFFNSLFLSEPVHFRFDTLQAER